MFNNKIENISSSRVNNCYKMTWHTLEVTRGHQWALSSLSYFPAVRATSPLYALISRGNWFAYKAQRVSTCLNVGIADIRAFSTSLWNAPTFSELARQLFKLFLKSCRKVFVSNCRSFSITKLPAYKKTYSSSFLFH